MAPLMDDEIVCLMDRNHALAQGAMTRKQYLCAPHIVPLSYSTMHRGVIDKHLANLRVTRNARVIVPFFSIAPNLLPGTDLIFTISRHFADYYARTLPLTVVPCPIDFPRMRFYQIWHSRNQQSAAQQWIRGILKEVAEQMFAQLKQETAAGDPAFHADQQVPRP